MPRLHCAPAARGANTQRATTKHATAGTIALTCAVATAYAVLTPAVPAHAAAARGATCHGAKVTMVGTASSEVIHGTPGRDVINGLGGNDTIYGGEGNDLVCGGSGSDSLYGGAGNDRLDGELDRLHTAQEDGIERIGDTLNGGPGNDRLDAGTDTRPADIVVYDTYSWDGSAHGVHLDLRKHTARGAGLDTFTGQRYSITLSAHDDIVDGTNRRDRISTGAGRDKVHARGGDDFVDVDDSHRWPGGEADRVWGGRGDDQISADGGQDHLSGGPGNDMLSASGTGNDVLLGGNGIDRFYAQLGDTAGRQTFDGGGGFNFLQMESSVLHRKGARWTGLWNMTTGAMKVTLGHKIRLTVSHIDSAYLETPATAWSVTGTTGDDKVYGDTVTDLSSVNFDGLAGDDVLSGTAGDDVFNGGPGDDHSWGMFNGDDTCISVETIDGDDCEHVS
jgi:Ca2+-binding RTX toxin-like protein